jgi:antitoxin YefM
MSASKMFERTRHALARSPIFALGPLHSGIVRHHSGIDEIPLDMYRNSVHKMGEWNMSIETTYTAARANLASLMDSAVEDREIIMIRRRRGEDVALIAADELESLLETAHLLRSPKNAARLLSALQRALANGETPSTVADLRREIGIDSTP